MCSYWLIYPIISKIFNSLFLLRCFTLADFASNTRVNMVNSSSGSIILLCVLVILFYMLLIETVRLLPYFTRALTILMSSCWRIHVCTVVWSNCMILSNVGPTRRGTSPASTRCWSNVGLVWGHRLRRWPNINSTLDQRTLFTGSLGPKKSRKVNIMLCV